MGVIQNMTPILLLTKPDKEYALLDSGEGQKLERYGSHVIARPDPQAIWKKSLSETEWKKADATFVPDLGWVMKPEMPEEWILNFYAFSFEIKFGSFKHTGIFPEQAPNWEWIQKIVSENKRDTISVLNLFGYTGGATLAAAKAGADVVHLDGSKSAISWAKKNAELSGLAEKPIRWILDDARAFLKREVKRGNKYDGIVMDPPAFGRGPKGEVWKIEEHFLELLDLVKRVLSDKPLFIIINGYASGYSAIGYRNALEDLMKDAGGVVEAGEIGIEDAQGRVLPAGIVARWKASA